MRFSAPHPIPYQGSKRRLAPAILSHVPERSNYRLVEPFAGSAAITLAAASQRLFETYLIADVLEPLIGIWRQVIDGPIDLAHDYEALWQRERKYPIEAYYEIRGEFNNDRNPAKLLYLLARCVKNAVRFNPAGQFNQSPDKRRTRYAARGDGQGTGSGSRRSCWNSYRSLRRLHGMLQASAVRRLLLFVTLPTREQVKVVTAATLKA